MTINKTAVFAVFNAADEDVSLADRLLTLGIGDRATARPLAIEWAAAKYKAKIIKGQRGDTLPQNSAAIQAVSRVLSVIFPSADMPQAKPSKPTANKVDPVKSLVTRYTKLTAAEKRRFLASI
jgi:hypothetical protein